MVVSGSVTPMGAFTTYSFEYGTTPSLIRGDFYLSTIKKQKKQLEDELAHTKRTLIEVSSSPQAPTVVVEKTVPELAP